MTNSILNVSPIEEIEHRYERLNIHIQRRLQDDYNFWLGLELIAYGKDWQREDALERVNGRISEGRPAFIITPAVDDFNETAREFSESDRVHLQELKNLRDYANQQAMIGMPREAAQSIYRYLVIMLYGSYGRKYIE